MKKKPINMATGGLMSQPPYIKDLDKSQDTGITPYDVNTPQSARKGMPSRLLSPSRTRFSTGGSPITDDDLEKVVRDFNLQAELTGNKKLTLKEIKEILGKDITKARKFTTKKAMGGLMRKPYNTGGETFPDLSGDGQITKEDILIGRGVIKKAKGGLMNRMKFDKGQLSTKEVIEMKKMEQLQAMKDSGLPLTDQQEQELESYNAAKAVKPAEMALGGMIGIEKGKYDQRPDYQAYAEGDVVEDMNEAETDMEMMAEENQSLLEPMGMNEEPMDDMEDEDMGDMDAVVDVSALSEEEEKILDEAIEMHPELEAIIPKIVATEFTDDGEVEGPGTGTSDSIPALLSDGEFVFTAKAVKHLGVDRLRKMMKQAEEAYDAGIKSQAEQQEMV